MKVWANRANEDWIIDRLVDEFKSGNSDIWVDEHQQADIIWLLADFAWKNVGRDKLLGRTVVSTIHHIVPEKWTAGEAWDFSQRDILTTVYHVPNEHTAHEVARHTDKPIHVIPYWANDCLWQRSSLSKNELRQKHGIPFNAFVIGSFQRDTEGAGISQGIFLPKKEKGPDLLAVAIEHYDQVHDDVFVVLAGWRRQYIMGELDKVGIKYKYFELPPQETLCELYQCLDLYPVTARYEGGPQSLIEAGLLGVPVVSRDVGIASHVLPSSAISHHASDAEPAVPNIQSMKLPVGFSPYRALFESLVK